MALGLALSDGALMEKEDVVFQADVPRVVTELTRSAGRHYRTKVHPTFVLFLNPAGRMLRAVLGRPRLAAVVLTALAGGVAVAGMRELLRRAGLGEPLASLWTAVLATSSAQVFFGSVPETFAFSAAALTVLFALHAGGAPRFVLSVGAGIVAFGMLITNIVALAVLELGPAGGGGRRVARAVAAVAAVVACSAALAAVQKRAYPDSLPFYARGSFGEEPQYVHVPPTAAALGTRVKDLAAHLFVFNLAAPELEVAKPSARFPVSTFPAPALDRLRPAGIAHAGLWLGLTGYAALRARRAARVHPLLRPLGGWIAFNAALHLVYGDVLFLYGAQWTFAVVAAVALAAGPERRLVFPLSGLIAAQAFANAAFVLDLFRLYG